MEQIVVCKATFYGTHYCSECHILWNRLLFGKPHSLEQTVVRNGTDCYLEGHILWNRL